jgi:hypothetical protein
MKIANACLTARTPRYSGIGSCEKIRRQRPTQESEPCRLWVLAVSKRLLEKVRTGISNNAGSFRGLAYAAIAAISG